MPDQFMRLGTRYVKKKKNTIEKKKIPVQVKNQFANKKKYVAWFLGGYCKLSRLNIKK